MGDANFKLFKIAYIYVSIYTSLHKPEPSLLVLYSSLLFSTFSRIYFPLLPRRIALNNS